MNRNQAPRSACSLIVWIGFNHSFKSLKRTSTMKRTLLFCTLVAAALTAQPAKADPVAFDITFSGLAFSGSAIFTVSSLGGGQFDVTGVVPGGSVTDSGFGNSAIVGLSDYLGPDQTLFYPNGGTYFDFFGLSFALANGVDINLYVDSITGPTAVESDNTGSGGFFEDVTETVTPATIPPPTVTPEPSSFILLGTGALGCIGAARRKFRKA
jgi:hypothetical protein